MLVQMCPFKFSHTLEKEIEANVSNFPLSKISFTFTSSASGRFSSIMCFSFASR